MTPLEVVQKAVVGHMEVIRAYFKPGVKITVVVRTPKNPERDFVITDDEPNEVVAVMERRKAAGRTGEAVT